MLSKQLSFSLIQPNTISCTMDIGLALAQAFHDGIGNGNGNGKGLFYSKGGWRAMVRWPRLLSLVLY